ncbi:hypothetical protein ACQP2Y_27840 [Actinoplanes sp. CA-051413]|uniref:hypothetical protein n=1 Tax=Actinoplanes sp. CA-051413 TaxID=3239899 RepID=UPI003D994913
MSTLPDLRADVGWAAPPTELEWAGIEQAIGLRYPAEFRELCSLFPPGVFQSFLKVLHPSAESDPAAYAAEVGGYAALLRDDAQEKGFPYPLYPAPDGVVPWATIGFDYVICWLPEGDTPDAWPVVVCESRLIEWQVTGLSTAEFMRAITTVPSGVPMLAYVAEARQPPTFVAFKPAGGPSSYASATQARPRAGYWLEGEVRTPLAEPVNAVADLAAVVAPGPKSTVDRVAVLTRIGRGVPPDFFRLVDTLGAVSVGPATVSAPDGSATDFFAQLKQLGDRVAELRAAGAGPIGTIHPESGGLITWGRLRGGGYLCWLPASGKPKEWPVVILDESLRFSVTYYMSASRFLLELATRPERVALPPTVH